MRRPINVPLDRDLLVEASAGTGKTYALTTLVARLIVESGWRIDKLLIVTFTIAATGELRSRIRSTLRDALNAAQGDTTGDFHGTNVLGERQRPGTVVPWSKSGAGPSAVGAWQTSSSASDPGRLFHGRRAGPGHRRGRRRRLWGTPRQKI